MKLKIAVTEAIRRLKLFSLSLRFCFMTPDQIVEWFDSEEHFKKLDALMGLGPVTEADLPERRKMSSRSTKPCAGDPQDVNDNQVPGKRADQLRPAKPSDLSADGRSKWCIRNK